MVSHCHCRGFTISFKSMYFLQTALYWPKDFPMGIGLVPVHQLQPFLGPALHCLQELQPSLFLPDLFMKLFSHFPENPSQPHNQELCRCILLTYIAEFWNLYDPTPLDHASHDFRVGFKDPEEGKPLQQLIDHSQIPSCPLLMLFIKQ